MQPVSFNLTSVSKLCRTPKCSRVAISRKWSFSPRLLQFVICFKVISRTQWAVSSKNNDRIDSPQCEKVQSNQLTKRPMGMFSPVLSWFSQRLCNPFVRAGHTQKCHYRRVKYLSLTPSSAPSDGSARAVAVSSHTKETPPQRT